jgi:hypothetical protein
MSKLKLVAGKHYSGAFHSQNDIEKSLLDYLNNELDKCNNIINEFFSKDEWSDDEVILFETIEYRKRVILQQIKNYNK